MRGRMVTAEMAVQLREVGEEAVVPMGLVAVLPPLVALVMDFPTAVAAQAPMVPVAWLPAWAVQVGRAAAPVPHPFPLAVSAPPVATSESLLGPSALALVVAGAAERAWLVPP